MLLPVSPLLLFISDRISPQQILMTMKHPSRLCLVSGRHLRSVSKYIANVRAILQKHEYAKPVKRKIKPVEDFDPRPPEYRGAVTSRLQDLLEKLRGEQLCVSFLFDPKCQHWDNDLSPAQPSSHNSPDATGLKCTIAAFKSSLQVSEDQAQRIEQSTRKQRQSSLWYSVRRYRITSSIFGSILSRRDSTPPDSLVLRIIQPRSFSTAATTYGIMG